jgi:hypothetical protein
MTRSFHRKGVGAALSPCPQALERGRATRAAENHRHPRQILRMIKARWVDWLVTQRLEVTSLDNSRQPDQSIVQ